jgi:hypothetical protein
MVIPTCSLAIILNIVFSGKWCSFCDDKHDHNTTTKTRNMSRRWPIHQVR